MKIVIIGPNVGIGGVERASTNIANGLVDLGHEVTYLALIPEKPFFQLNASYIEPKDFNYTSMNVFKTLNFIKENINHIQPDAILCYTKFYAALANLALCFTRYQIYVTERSSPFYRWPKKIEWFCRFSFSLKKVKGVISQTNIASKYHQKYYGKTKYTVIHNAVREIKSYPNLVREKSILAVGRFNDDCKGFDLLVDAFNRLSNNDWRLVFAGGSQEEGQYLLDLVDESKKSKIDFLGAVKNIDLLYAKAGIFVMPSRTEGFPNALAEALVSGCCCVSFDFVAGPRDLIETGVNGVIVEANNTIKLAAVIDDLISNDKKRYFYQQEALKVNNKLNQNTITQLYFDFLIQ